MSTYPRCIERELKSQDEAIASLKKDYAERRRVVIALAPVAMAVEEAVRECKQIGRALIAASHHGIYVYMPSANAVSDALPLLRALAKRGYRRKDLKDEPERRTRIWTLVGGVEEGSGKITFELSFGEGARCQYIKTGTKTVEQPVYELRCDPVAPLPPVDEEQLQAVPATNGAKATV